MTITNLAVATHILIVAVTYRLLPTTYSWKYLILVFTSLQIYTLKMVLLVTGIHTLMCSEAVHMAIWQRLGHLVEVMI